MKKLIMIHGWGGSGKGGWFDWLREEVEKRGWNVESPDMPNTTSPKISEWVEHLKKVAEGVRVEEDTFFIGHSIGCQTILRYLEKLPEKTKIGGVILVAPWMHLDENTIKEDGEEVVEIAKPWMETPINFKKIKQHTDSFFAIFSDNDPYVPLSDADLFKEELSARTVVLENQEHFCENSEFPVLLESLLKMAKEK